MEIKNQNNLNADQENEKPTSKKPRKKKSSKLKSNPPEKEDEILYTNAMYQKGSLFIARKTISCSEHEELIRRRFQLVTHE